MSCALAAEPPPAEITIWSHLEIPLDRQWEAAYQRFESPQQEIAKFKRRLARLGCQHWPEDAQIVELFCGRGNGLHALSQLGFSRLCGVDLSHELLSAYRGPAQLYVGDCRQLAFEDRQLDIAIVQGGLHHLPTLPDDLERCLQEIHRILKPQGTLCLVEPWATPFLHLAHAACSSTWLRRCWGKLDALAEMTERELTTYEQWLGQPHAILAAIERWFDIRFQQIAWGKLMLRANPKPGV